MHQVVLWPAGKWQPRDESVTGLWHMNISYAEYPMKYVPGLTGFIL